MTMGMTMVKMRMVTMVKMMMMMTMAKVKMMTMVKISPRPGNKPEVEVVAEVAVYCNHSEAGS